VDLDAVHFVRDDESQGSESGWTFLSRSNVMSAPSIVFAHGLWADGSCFSKVIPTLQAEGHEVVSTQNSLDSVNGDVAAVRRALGRVSSPAILVGHSYGGTVITAAGMDDRVVGLVYICALAPDAGETSQNLLDRYPTSPVFAHIEVAEGRIWLRAEGIGDFAGDLPEQEQKLVWATQGAPDVDLFNQKVEAAAWRSKPSWYIVGKNDRTVSPDLERFLAKRMGATTHEADSSHVPMLSHPSLVIDTIRAAADAVHGSMVG
jgi:pimeloyl-ACP methyl ester carboxylesterase